MRDIYMVRVNGVAMICGNQESAMGWVNFCLDKGMCPQVVKNPQELAHLRCA